MLISVNEENPQEAKCPVCGSMNTIKSGKHYNKTNVVQRRRCKICGTSFSVGGYFKHRYHLKVILFASELYKEGLSIGDIVVSLNEKLGVDVSRTTILNWLRKTNTEMRAKSHPKKGKIQETRQTIDLSIPLIVRCSTSISPCKLIIIEETITI